MVCARGRSDDTSETAPRAARRHAEALNEWSTARNRPSAPKVPALRGRPAVTAAPPGPEERRPLFLVGAGAACSAGRIAPGTGLTGGFSSTSSRNGPSAHSGSPEAAAGREPAARRGQRVERGGAPGEGLKLFVVRLVLKAAASTASRAAGVAVCGGRSNSAVRRRLLDDLAGVITAMSSVRPAQTTEIVRDDG